MKIIAVAMLAAMALAGAVAPAAAEPVRQDAVQQALSPGAFHTVAARRGVHRRHRVCRIRRHRRVCFYR